MQTIVVDGESLDLQMVEKTANGAAVTIAPAALEKMKRSRLCIEDIIASGDTVYGVNTGFGKLSNIHIAADDLKELQLK